MMWWVSNIVIDESRKDECGDAKRSWPSMRKGTSRWVRKNVVLRIVTGSGFGKQKNGRATVKHDEATRETKALRFDAPPYSSYVSIARTSNKEAHSRFLCQQESIESQESKLAGKA